jgi:serine/threonine protein kinase
MNNSIDQTQFGRYKIVRQLGKGSMSTVYLAIDPLLNREVAIKVINPQLSRQPGFIKRFEREAMALARLDHPSIIHIYDMGQVDILYYMVIQYLSGGTLKERLQKLRAANEFMPFKEVGKILTTICNAVDYIHRAGFIHRDLKPSNVMFDEFNEPLLADFGIVKAIKWDSFTAEGGILGTPFYMAPENFTLRDIDQRSDIYSLGVILYEMCTGDVPFRASMFAEVAKAHMYTTPTPPQEFNPYIPAAMSDVILRALEKEPSKRFQTALSLSQAYSALFPAPQKGTVRVSSSRGSISTQLRQRAYLKSAASGARYKLSPDFDNRIGRSTPVNRVEVDLTSEEFSEYTHSIHAIVRFNASGWELEAPKDIHNPLYINNIKIQPGDRKNLSDGDQITVSKIKLVFET